MDNNNYNVFNAIRGYTSQSFRDIVPMATADNIAQISSILLNNQYQPLLNEFVSTMINRIGLTMIANRTQYENPLERFKKGSMPLGTDIQELYENPAEKQQYEVSNKQMAKVLLITDPDTHVAYYRRNRQDYYTKSISEENLQGAFVSWDKFNEYIRNITNSLYSGNYIDEFKYTKALIDGAYDNDKVITKVVTSPVSKDDCDNLLEEIQNTYSYMTFPSTEYNAYSKFSGAKGTITTWTTKDRISIIIRADILNKIKVKSLASAFNLNEVEFREKMFVVDKFNNPEILFVICDEAWLQIYDNMMRFTEQFNASALVWNEYLHVWNTYAISPFANAVLFCTKKPTPATEISFNHEGSIEVEKGSQEGLELTITPTNATTNIEYNSDDSSIFIVEKIDDLNSKITGIEIGSANLIATSDNGLVAQVQVDVIEASE